MAKNEKSVIENLISLRDRAGYSSYDNFAKVAGYRGASSIQRYFSEDGLDGNFLPLKFIRKIAPALTGRGSPTISEAEIFALAGVVSTDIEAFEKISKDYDIPPAMLSSNLETLDIPIQEVPVIDIVQAGIFTDVVNPYPKGEGSETIHIPYKHGRIFAVRISGQSMNLEFSEGSIIVIDYADTQLIDRKYYIIREGTTTTFKQYRANPDRFDPRSTDPSFETIFPTKNTRVIGRVVQAVKTY